MRGTDRARLSLALAAILVAIAPAVAQEGEGRARRLERQINDARARDKLLLQDRAALAREVESLQAETTAAAAALQTTEGQVERLSLQLDQTEAQGRHLQEGLSRRRERLAELVLAVERLARVPREALLLRDQAPLDAARAGRLLAHAVPALDAEAATMRRELAALASLRQRLDRERATLEASRERLAGEREGLEKLVERRTRLVAALDVERAALAVRTERMGRELGSVRELLEKLAAEKLAARQRAAEEAERQRQESARAEAAAIARLPARPFREARGLARPPVEGALIRAWGSVGPSGQAERGHSYQTAPNATIVSPWHGTIAYAGLFRGYGVILIVETSDGYHWLIAGMGRLDVGPGQAVRAGEPVGTATKGGPDKPLVYVELRRGGQPIDPGPWLAAPNGKVSG